MASGPGLRGSRPRAAPPSYPPRSRSPRGNGPWLVLALAIIGAAGLGYWLYSGTPRAGVDVPSTPIETPGEDPMVAKLRAPPAAALRGSASGQLVVEGDVVPLAHAYVFEDVGNTVFRHVVLSESPLPDETLTWYWASSRSPRMRDELASVATKQGVRMVYFVLSRQNDRDRVMSPYAYHPGFATLKDGYATPSGHDEVAGMPRVTLSDGFSLEATRIEGEVVEARVRLAPAYTDRPISQAPVGAKDPFKVHWQFEASFSVQRP